MNKEEREKIVKSLLEEYKILEQVSFNEFDIHDKLMINSDLYIRYYERYLSEKQELEGLESIKERLIGKIYDELRFPDPSSKNPHASKNLDRKEIISYYIPQDERYIRMCEIIEKQKIRVEFFEISAKAIDKMSWNMKNYLDSLKLKNI